jgi:hypothetical protein
LSALSAEEQGTGEAPKKRQKAPKKEKAEKKVAQSASARDLRSTSRRDSVSSGSVIEPKVTVSATFRSPDTKPSYPLDRPRSSSSYRRLPPGRELFRLHDWETEVQNHRRKGMSLSYKPSAIANSWCSTKK